MKKKVVISIKGAPVMGENEEGGFELMTDGMYIQENGISKFCYEETDLTGVNGLRTTFEVEPDRVILRRGDGGDGDMIFSESAKHHFLHVTPYGYVTMGIDTHHIKKNMRDDGGSLEIRYDLEVDNVSISQNLFEIDIKEFDAQVSGRGDGIAI